MKAMRGNARRRELLRLIRERTSVECTREDFMRARVSMDRFYLEHRGPIERCLTRDSLRWVP